MASAFGCGLGTGGLLDLPDASTGDGVAPDGSVIDGPAGDEGLPADDGGPSTDAGDSVEASADVALDAPADARDARADAPPDARDARVDAPDDAPADAPTDSGPLPIVWDGGAIADPPFVDTDWVSFCATLGACGLMPSMSACVALSPQPTSHDALIPPLSIINRVVNVASPNCTSVSQALGNGSMCTAADACSGNSLVTCRMGFMMTIDCGGLGMVCTNGNGNPGCGFGDCAASQEGSTYCVGPYNVAQCTSGRYVPLLDCLTFGATCAGPDATARCQGQGGMACAGGPTCNSGSIAECINGVPLNADCAGLYDPNALSFTCVTSTTGAPLCAAGIACDPATFVDTCNGGMNMVHFCNAGAMANFNCAMGGFLNGCTGGHCVP
jgi:hypothetical protein